MDTKKSKLVKTVPIWELRELMSFNANIKLDHKEQELVDQIINHITNNQNSFKWQQKMLSINGEAKIQGILRLKGYNIKCFGLDKFPDNIKDLSKKLEKLSLVNRLIVNIKYIKGKINLLTQIFIDWARFQGFVLFGLFSIVGYFYSILMRPDLLIYSIILTWVLCNVTTIIVHEWWTHGLIKPKNKVLHFILNFIGYCLFWSSKLQWKFEHLWHHKYWKTKKDLDYITFQNTPWWFYLLFATEFRTFLGKLPPPPPPGFLTEKEYFYSKILDKMSITEKFFEKIWVIIPLITAVILIYLIGFINYMYFIGGPTFFFRCYIIGFNEIITHWPLRLTREEESNTPCLFPICCGTAYHKTHHYEPTTIVLGPGKLKYLNIQYWFIKLFFRQSPGTKFS